MKKNFCVGKWTGWRPVKGLFALALAGFLTLAPGAALGSECCWYVAGEWTLINQKTISSCAGTPIEVWEITVTQQGCDITVKNEWVTATGKIDGAKAAWSVRYKPAESMYFIDANWEVTFSGSSISGGCDFDVGTGYCGGRVEVEGTASLIAPTEGVLDAPGLSITADSTAVDISWTPVEGALGYLLALAMVDAAGNLIPGGVGTFDWPDTRIAGALPAGFAAFVAVAAYGEAGMGGLSNLMFFSIF